MSTSVYHMVMESGEMRLEDALELFTSENGLESTIDFWIEDIERETGQEIPELTDAIYERFVQLAKETIQSQDNAIALIFENCEANESGYETEMMMFATEIISDDKDVIEQIKQTYQNIDGEDDYSEGRRFYIQYAIERSGKIGWKILFDLGIDMDEFYEREAGWAAIYNGGFGEGPGERHPGGIEEWIREYKDKKLREYKEEMGI